MPELDRERILAKVDELNGYLKELNGIAPGSFKEYQNVEKKRACERLLQVSIEVVIDISTCSFQDCAWGSLLRKMICSGS